MIGLSIAPAPVPNPLYTPATPTATPAGLVASNYDTGFNIVNQQVAQNGSGILAYPLDSPKYIMTFTISAFTRNSLNDVGQFQPAPGYPGIVLPLPEQLHDLDSVNWAEAEMGFFTGTALGALNPTASTQERIAAGGLPTAIGAAGGLVDTFAPGTTQALGNIGGAVLSLNGISPNQFMTLLMRGPKYKRHRFSWSMAPENFQEADNLRQIIRVFRNAMAPGIYGTIANAPVLWSYPKIFYVRLYPNSKFLYKFKPCVIDNFAVNYTPANKAAFLRNGTGTIGDNPPAIAQLQMELIELEYWTEGNYDDTNDPTNVYTQANKPFTGQDVINTVTNAGAQAWESVKNGIVTPAQ